MHPNDGDDGQQLIEKAQQALALTRIGKDQEALDHIATTQPTLGTEGAETRELILLLFSECSAMVSTLGDGGSAPVKVQVFDDTGEEVSIDQADPPVRTAVRTLLAEVNGNTEAAEEQVEIALANAAPEEMDSLLLQALRWTIRLSTECDERGLPLPAWIADTLTD